MWQCDKLRPFSFRFYVLRNLWINWNSHKIWKYLSFVFKPNKAYMIFKNSKRFLYINSLSIQYTALKPIFSYIRVWRKPSSLLWEVEASGQWWVHYTCRCQNLSTFGAYNLDCWNPDWVSHEKYLMCDVG